MKAKHSLQEMESVGVYGITAVLSQVVFSNEVESLRNRGFRRGDEIFENTIRHSFDGHSVSMTSSRYRLFAIKGVQCVSCGIEGTYFSLERQKNAKDNNNRYHFNLYGEDEQGNKMLLTKDHIVPVKRGGNNSLENLQVMCSKCNDEKAGKPTEKDFKEALNFLEQFVKDIEAIVMGPDNEVVGLARDIDWLNLSITVSQAQRFLKKQGCNVELTVEQ